MKCKGYGIQGQVPKSSLVAHQLFRDRYDGRTVNTLEETTIITTKNDEKIAW